MAQRNPPYIHVVSDGTRSGSRAFLVVDVEGSEVRYPIPNVLAVSWRMDERDNRSRAVLVLQGVTVDTKIQLRTDLHDAADIISEIAAGKLAREEK